MSKDNMADEEQPDCTEESVAFCPNISCKVQHNILYLTTVNFILRSDNLKCFFLKKINRYSIRQQASP